MLEVGTKTLQVEFLTDLRSASDSTYTFFWDHAQPVQPDVLEWPLLLPTAELYIKSIEYNFYTYTYQVTVIPIVAFVAKV